MKDTKFKSCVAHRLQPPEPASKDPVFKPGASTWNTDDPKQQHHAPGMTSHPSPCKQRSTSCNFSRHYRQTHCFCVCVLLLKVACSFETLFGIFHVVFGKFVRRLGIRD